ncbi:hypothetical protein [Terrimonas ferruginea]|uniref:hypothetical protein n=1 Tax=Terrimonas ferruginea TaxID=249 RepID=UPI000421034E|nr:hypothetical protein [Terrimonas ferruginea]
MNKKVLAVYFSQTGQLGQIIDRFTAPLEKAGASVEKLVIQPAKKFPFPWTSPAFFGAMPDCVLLKPAELEPFTLRESNYDLIIIGYQPWFLSPSIPANSFLQHPAFLAVARNTPVVTISGCRNMWINAQEKIKGLLSKAGARLVGNIALVDKHNNYVSLVTIIHWMFSGRRDKKWGIFPKPGVTDEDIANSAIFGETVSAHLAGNNWESLQPRLVEQKAIQIKYHLMFFEGKGARFFPIWANLINKKTNKGPWVTGFKYYLLFALLIMGPLMLLIDTLFFRWFKLNRIKEQKQYYSGVALN